MALALVAAAAVDDLRLICFWRSRFDGLGSCWLVLRGRDLRGCTGHVEEGLSRQKTKPLTTNVRCNAVEALFSLEGCVLFSEAIFECPRKYLF